MDPSPHSPSSDLPPSGETAERWAPAVDGDPTMDSTTNGGQQGPHHGEGATQAQTLQSHRRLFSCCRSRSGRKQRTPSGEFREGASQETDSATPTEGEGGVTVGALLPDSIYVWACGENAPGQQQDLKTSDELIGSTILLFQALSYIVIIVRSDDNGDGDDNDEDVNYTFGSVIAAIYLLVQTASPDLRAGFSLLVDGASLRYRAFGAAMLAVFALLVTAAMKVIFSSADNDAAVVAEAVTVLFIADLDEKALSFFGTIPQEWRLFWLVNMVGLSFVLALAGVAYIGDPTTLKSGWLEDDYGVSLSASFMLVMNPAGTMMLSFWVTRVLRVLCDARDNEDEAGRELWLWRVMRKSTSGAINAARVEPLFYMVLFVWFCAAAANWYLNFYSYYFIEFYYEGGLHVHGDLATILIPNFALAVGLAMLMFRSWRDRMRARSIPGPQPSLLRRAGSVQTAQGHHHPADNIDDATRHQRRSRVPPLLVGWGLGYWLGSVLYVLGESWPRGLWDEPHVMVTIVGYVVLPLTFLLGVFMVADSDVYGLRVKRILEPVADALKDEAGVFHWMMVTVLRDLTFVWAAYTLIIVVGEF